MQITQEKLIKDRWNVTYYDDVTIFWQPMRKWASLEKGVTVIMRFGVTESAPKDLVCIRSPQHLIECPKIKTMEQLNQLCELLGEGDETN